jgi:hypothetical protein
MIQGKIRFCQRGQIMRVSKPVSVFVCLIAAALALSAPFAPITPTPARAQNSCEGLVAPRLTAGQAARVITNYGLSLKNRAAPGSAGSIEVDLLPYGAVATVVEGPVCGYGYVWWKLNLPNGTTGWAAEGSASEYFLEPSVIGLHLYQRRDNGAAIEHYFVTPDGLAQLQNTFTIPPLNATPQDVWQQVEIDYLASAIETISTECPEKLAGTAFENVTLEQALQINLAPYAYDFYPSPDGEKLVLVRHQLLRVPRCDNVVPERTGISTVFVIDADGASTELFPFPQHGTVPESVDVYRGGEPSQFNVYFEDVAWSPNGKYVAFTTDYRYQCNRQDCYRIHLYIANLDTGQLYVLGEGRRIGWTNGGEGINFFRLISDGAGNQVAHLYTARPDGSARQEIWLPGGAIYVSDVKEPLNLPWTSGGTRVMVVNAGGGEVMLFALADRAFTPVVTLPDLMMPENRLAVYAMQGDKVYLWATIRGEFVRQNARTGDWYELESELATTGIAPVRVRPFDDGVHLLVEMADGSAYVLNIDADELVPVVFAQ